MSDDRNRGLYGKYRVERVDGKPIKGGHCIVMEVGDWNTHAAIHAFADSVELDGYTSLASDLRRLVRDHGFCRRCEGTGLMYDYTDIGFPPIIQSCIDCCGNGRPEGV